MNPQAQAVCLADIKHAHQWATRALADAEADDARSLRSWALKTERERLAALYGKVKQGAGPDGKFPNWRRDDY